MVAYYLIPRSEEEEEEEKGPGFSHLHMCLIVVELHHFHILLIYICIHVIPILLLRVTLSVDILWQHMSCKETRSIILIQQSI